jgi:hypothetical protein
MPMVNIDTRRVHGVLLVDISGRLNSSTADDAEDRIANIAQGSSLRFLPDYLPPRKIRLQCAVSDAIIDQRPAATAQPLLLGAHVRLHSSEATGVIIANSIDSDRVRVRWDDTGEVTHCLRAKLVPVR